MVVAVAVVNKVIAVVKGLFEGVVEGVVEVMVLPLLIIVKWKGNY